MSNKFISFLEAVGRDFKKGLPWIEIGGEIAITAFAPGLAPIFHSTVSAVVLAEQKFSALGNQSGSGAQKLADVIQLIGPLIKVAMADAGRTNDDTAITAYINAVVTILNLTPTTVQQKIEVQ